MFFCSLGTSDMYYQQINPDFKSQVKLRSSSPFIILTLKNVYPDVFITSSNTLVLYLTCASMTLQFEHWLV